MRIVTLFFVFLSFFTQCYNTCEEGEDIATDNGILTDADLAKVPYQSNDTVKLKHSAGYTINYNVTRKSYDDYISFDESCAGMIVKSNSVNLEPDYPVFPIYINISNSDGINTNYQIVVGRYYFYIPQNIDNTVNSEYYKFADSVTINNKVYYNVVKTKSFNGTYDSSDLIYCDSLYYNFDAGIIKITMSNNEYYEISE